MNDVHVKYGRGRSAVFALRGISLSVEVGSIYGILGPSGCGKTSVLNCCLGLLNPDSGSVKVFGHSPRTPGLGVPGPTVGFMPQDHTLHQYFNALEILSYYCTIFRVDGPLLKSRRILQLLDLWNGKIEHRQLTHLSGGQRRRVSLACAMVHEPSILIL